MVTLILFLAEKRHPRIFFRNTENNQFEQITEGLGLAPLPAGTNPILADINNNGFLDVLLLGETSHLLSNQGDGTFDDISDALNLGSVGEAISGVPGDFDGDGDLDFFVSAASNGGVLLENEGNANHWISIKAEGDRLNKDGIGARVRVVSGDLVQTRYVGTQSGGGTQNPLPIHLGLGTQTSIDSVIVSWPLGNEDVLTNVSVDEERTISQSATSFAVTPVTISFGDVLVNDTSIRSFTVRNLNDSPLSVSSLTLGGSSASTFAIDQNPFELAALQEQQIDVSFSPASPGAFDAALMIETSERPVNVSLRGFGNVAPVVNAALPDSLVQLSQETLTFDLYEETRLFFDANGDSLLINATSSNQDVATVSIIAQRFLEILMVKGGSSTITVEADDNRGANVSTSFELSVNTPPELTTVLPNISIGLDPGVYTLDLDADPVVFFDADDDALLYTVESSHTTIATAEITGESTLEVSLLTSGIATITLTANDGKGGIETTTFQITDPGTNSPPLLSLIEDMQHAEGETVLFQVDASDPENTTIQYSASGLPPDLTIHPSDGVISGNLTSSASAESPYTVTITVTDSGTPTLSQSTSFQWQIDNVLLPAAAPTGLVATTDGEQITLRWDFNSETNIVAYRIYRRTGVDPEAQIGEVSESDSMFTDNGIVAGTDYIYRITALNDEGVESSFSNEVTARLLPMLIAAPTGISTRPGPNQITISWNAVSNAERYDVYRYQNNNAPALLQSGINGVTHTDTTITTGQLYFYQVRAIDAFGRESEFSVGSGTEAFFYPRNLSLQTSRTFADPTLGVSARMVGLPGNVNLDVARTFEGEVSKDWDAYADNGDAVNYLRAYSSTNRLHFQPGTGYWIISRNSWVMDTTVAPVSLNDENGFVIPYRPGWNIISNPHAEPIEWREVQLANSIPDSLWRFNGSYRVANQFTPYEGYYIFNRNDSKTELLIPYPGTSGGKKESDDDLSVGRKKSTGDRLELEMSFGKLVKSRIVIGVSSEALETLDDYDQLAPPSDFSKAQFYVKNNELDIEYTRLATEYRSAIGDGQVFELEVLAPSGEYVVLSARDVSAFADFEVQLVDVSTGKFYDLHDLASFTIDTHQKITKFKLLIGNAAFVDEQRKELLPNVFALQPNYPNPFRLRTTIEYAIPRDAGESEVLIEIFDILGRQVATLVDERQDVGYHRVEWDGRSQSGTRLASGTYIYRLSVQGNASKTIARPLIFIK